MKKREAQHRTGSTLASLSLACALAATLGLTGCRGDRAEDPPRQFFPDMDDQQKWKPQTQTQFFADGRSMRQPAANTVAFSRFALSPQTLEGNPAWASSFIADRADLLKSDDAVFTGKDASGAYLEKIPVAVDRAMLERGQNRFNIYCAACHGMAGDGKGMVGQQWSYPLPTFHDDKYLNRSEDPNIPQWRDGYLFRTAREGVWTPDGTQNKMPGYAHALNVHDAWAVIAYIRALQESHRGTRDDVPAAQLATIDAAAKAAADAKAAAEQASADKAAADKAAADAAKAQPATPAEKPAEKPADNPESGKGGAQ